MEEWIDVSRKLPREGQTVDVCFSGIEFSGILFKDGRFWQVPGAITLPVEKWRQTPKKGRVIDLDAADGIGARGGM